jgi:hypothetical protein
LSGVGNIIGFACGGLAVALIALSIWTVTKGGGEGMTALLVELALLLVAVLALRPSRTNA